MTMAIPMDMIIIMIKIAVMDECYMILGLVNDNDNDSGTSKDNDNDNGGGHYYDNDQW